MPPAGHWVLDVKQASLLIWALGHLMAAQSTTTNKADRSISVTVNLAIPLLIKLIVALLRLMISAQGARGPAQGIEGGDGVNTSSSSALVRPTRLTNDHLPTTGQLM